MKRLTRHHTGLTTNHKRKGLVSANHSQALSETFFSVMIKILLLQNIINVKDSYKIYRVVILKPNKKTINSTRANFTIIDRFLMTDWPIQSFSQEIQN